MKKKILFAAIVFMLSKIIVLAGSLPVLNANRKEIFKEQSIDLPTGVTLKYVESGERKGTTIIFLHGFTDSWHSFEKVLPLFPSGLHTIAISLRGHGNSSKPANGYLMKDFAADIASFIKIKKLDACVIVGHSMGGIIAQQFALDHPSLIKGLVIVSSDHVFGNFPGLAEFKAEVQKLKDPVTYSFAEAFQKSTISKPVDSAFIDQCITETMKVTANAWKKIVDGFATADYSKKLEKIKSPTLILWGSNDLYCQLEDQKIMDQRIPISLLRVYEGTGHALHWEDPERFTDDIIKFVNSLK